jgi:ADP-heptose:LPS heptosyltransferase
MRPRVLVTLRALGLGDLLTAVPAQRALADAFADHHRVLATPGPLAPLALHAGLADEVVPTAALGPLERRLDRPAVAVNLHGCGPESHRVLAALRPQQMIAYRHPALPTTSGSPRWQEDEHEVARWCRLLVESGIPADPSRLEITAPARPVPALAVGATVVHPGASSPARRWPPDRWAAVARAERAAGRSVVDPGAPCEVGHAEAVAAGARLPPSAVLAGRTDVLDVAAVVAAAGRVVSGDTGVAHLATALGTPSVVLFGPVPPTRWGPPPGRPHLVLWSGRTEPADGETPDAGLLAIQVDQVLDALADLERMAPSMAG